MALTMLYGCVIFLLTNSLEDNVFANSCENDNCTAAIDIPLITKLNAPLKAELDISVLTIQLKELIVYEVKQAVSVAMKDLAENIVNKRTQSALENLQADNNVKLSTFLHEIEVKMEKSNAFLMSKQNISTNEIRSLTTMNDKLDAKIEQIKEKQTFTESRVSLVESEVQRTIQRDVIARKKDVRTMKKKLEGEIEQMKEQHKLTELKLSGVEAEVKRSTKRVAMTAHPSSTGTITNTIMKFDVVKYSVGITNLSTYKTTGKFTCEHEGLYLISASVMSQTSASYYLIRLNGIIISQTYIGQHNGSNVFTGAVTVTRKLNPNNQVWLYAEGSWYLYGGMVSKLTIIKIK